MSTADQWILWQLADSAFPAGSFGHSGGLETAWQLGEVGSFETYCSSTLQQLTQAALPFVLDVHRAPERFAELDELCDVFLCNHVANRASKAMGKSFAIAASRAFTIEVPGGHFAPTFGNVARLLEIERAAAARLFVFIQLRGVIASAIRLGVVGPLEGQRLQFKLSPLAEEVARQSLDLTTRDIAHTAPLLDLWQGAHDRLYSRLFQS